MPTLNERLGFAPTDRVAILHADDIGMCHAANRGALAALERGPATCGSIMVPCPWFREAADRAKADPELDLGVHLTLNAEWEHYRWGPVAGRHAVPSLVDAQGYLPRTSLEVVQNAKPDDVETELRAQIQMALEAGIDVTHIDSHMGTVFFPAFLPVYLNLAKEFRLPMLVARPDDATLEAAGLLSAKGMLHGMADAAEAAGFPILQGLDANSLAFEPGEGEAHNLRRLDALPEGVTYVICHPAENGPELESIAGDSAHQRAFESAFYGEEGGRKALAERGIHTLGMRPLRELLRDE